MEGEPRPRANVPLDKRDLVIAVLASRLGGDVMVTIEELEAFGSGGTEAMIWEDLMTLAVHVRVSRPARIIAGETVQSAPRAIGA